MPFDDTIDFVSNYTRVLPRDLFNEGNLVTNYGRLWILLEETSGHNAAIVQEDVPFFDIKQNEATGGIFIANLTFTIDGMAYRLERPLNSREKWPLMVVENDDDPDFEEVCIFDDDGNFTPEMLALIGLKADD